MGQVVINDIKPKYCNLRAIITNGYIYNQTIKEWLYRRVNVPEDTFDT